MTDCFNDDLIAECLTESDYIPELVEICDENDKPYVVGLLAINDLDPDDDRYDPVYLLHDILVNAAEMAPREALTLIDNAFNAMIDGIAETVEE
jgi:GT2 family glycosyltransferase